MLTLFFATLLSSFILGSQDYQLEILNPKVPVKQEHNNKDENKGRDIKLTLTLSSDRIDFGVLRPTVPVLRETSLKITTTNNFPYSIFAFEDGPLKFGTSVIPDTTCDNGTCSEVIKSAWTNPLVFGFGMSLDGENYQQLANEGEGEVKQAILKDKNEEQAKIIYKLNVPNTQISGIYSNTITFILVPDY